MVHNNYHSGQASGFFQQLSGTQFTVFLLIIVCSIPIGLWNHGKKIRANYPREGARESLVTLKFLPCAVNEATMPLVASIACLLISLYKDYDSVTHVVGRACRPDTKNFMTSISAATGDHAPQRYIWRICIALMIHQRLMDGTTMFGYLKLHALERGILTRGSSGLCKFTLLNGINQITHTAAQLCLVLLTYVSSSDYLLLHEGGFVGFLIFSVLHMGLCTFLFRWVHSDTLAPAKKEVSNELDKKEHLHLSYKWKFNTMVFNYSTAVASAYLFIRHNTYCEDYMYSYFCICEWLFVFSNVAFHCTMAFVDFRHVVLYMVDETTTGKQF